jgi:hypothetical protein
MPAVATVDDGGFATPHASGATSITAILLGTRSNQATLTVGPDSLTSIEVFPGSATVTVGSTQQYQAFVVERCSGSLVDVTSEAVWSSTAPNVATVSMGGLATGIATGSTSIKALFTTFTSPGPLVGVATLAVR